ncbi:hypothetical protein WISP_107392 [Willisornis vidua]|uniref:Uncharacterized protein n=1 Tax=Willisornis vidua TaxID=1566151 RepID=A0ABQ9D181_9PASS|nr:hypothetical protein WISP_107392 [Willisornis vidua]
MESEGFKTEHKSQGVDSPVPSAGEDHYLGPAGHTISDKIQNAIDFLHHPITLLAHVQLTVDQHPQVLFHWEAFQTLCLKSVTLCVVVVTQGKDPALGFVEHHTIGRGLPIQPVQILLQSLSTLQQFNTPTQFVVICKLRVHSMPSTTLSIKKLNRTGLYTEPRGTPLVTSYQLDVTHFTTTL